MLLWNDPFKVHSHAFSSWISIHVHHGLCRTATSNHKKTIRFCIPAYIIFIIYLEDRILDPVFWISGTSWNNIVFCLNDSISKNVQDIIIYHQISSYIIMYHHISSYHRVSSYIIINQNISSYIIIHHQISSYIIFLYNQISNIIKYHHILPNIIIYYQISSYNIMYHQLSSNIIIYRFISSNIIKCHHISSYIIKSSYIIIYHHVSSCIIICIIYHHISGGSDSISSSHCFFSPSFPVVVPLRRRPSVQLQGAVEKEKISARKAAGTAVQNLWYM